MLKAHADLAAYLVDPTQIVGQLGAVDHDAALLVFLEPIDAADHGGFAGSRGTADDDLLARRTWRLTSRNTWKAPYHLCTPTRSTA